MFYFIIPLTGRTESVNWEVVCELLGGTLRSLLNQSDPDFRVIVCSQDRPQINELQDPRVSFLHCYAPYPADNLESERHDQWIKVRLLFEQAVTEGARIICRLDGDDRISARLVRFARNNRHPTGFLIEKGYVWDYREGFFAPSGPVLKAPFYMRCGTCVLFDLRDFDSGDTTGLVSHLESFGTHTSYAKNAERIGRPFAKVDYPAAVYVLNHGAGLAYRRGWNTAAKARRHARLRRNRITVTEELRNEFMLDKPTVPANPRISGILSSVVSWRVRNA